MNSRNILTLHTPATRPHEGQDWVRGQQEPSKNQQPRPRLLGLGLRLCAASLLLLAGARLASPSPAANAEARKPRRNVEAEVSLPETP